MLSLSHLLAQGTAHAWLFIPSAILLGALHGLEPGHSKTMMAAFIVAVRGTVGQAVLLGLAATLSHTAIVWLVALGGTWLFDSVRPDAAEPYLQLASGLLIIGIALWMLRRVRCEHQRHDHDDPHHHTNHHHDHHHHAKACDHGHDHPADQTMGRVLDVSEPGYQDAHERQHAEEIRRRFSGREVTTAQIALFGITGGLTPCPGAITVLLLCLQLRRLALGSVLVLCFSIGLAATMVTSGVIAALSARYAERHFSGFGALVRKAPYVSGLLILAVGLAVAYQGWRLLAAAA